MANSALKTVRIVLWTLVVVAAIGAAGLYLYGNSRAPLATSGLGAGDYTLQTADGQEFTRSSFVGHPSMLFFGFVHCPDVCPTTLAEMASWSRALGEEGKDLKGYFITVDPERDTADIMGDYVAWVGNVTGVIGTPEEVAKAAKAWGVFYEKVGSGVDYTMNHTASVFLLDRNGNFQSTIAYQEKTETAIAKLRRLLNS